MIQILLLPSTIPLNHTDSHKLLPYSTRTDVTKVLEEGTLHRVNRGRGCYRCPTVEGFFNFFERRGRWSKEEEAGRRAGTMAKRLRHN